MEFGLMFFAGSDRRGGADRYALLRAAARFADARGFRAVWTPERHFHEFGGLFPNPSVLAAALAVLTQRVQIRAGSVIAPLHDPIRIAEEWSVADNLSGGRVAISFGSGWNADDFVFHPERYAERQTHLYAGIEEVKRLWRGEAVARANGAATSIDVRIHPPPIQPELPIWVTSSGHVDTFVSAGRLGANVLTHLIGQTIDELADKVRRYRAARAEAGFEPHAGTVTLMLHTFLGTDVSAVRDVVRGPMCDYLRSAVRLETSAAAGGGAISGGHRIERHDIPGDALQDLLEITFDRYFRTSSLLGTPETCEATIWNLEERGVNEVACLIDFGPPDELVMESLEHLDRLRAACTREAGGVEAAVRAFTEALG